MSEPNSQKSAIESQPRRCSALACVIAGLVLFSALFAFVDPAWEDTDDVRMSLIAAGIDDTAGTSELLLYENVLVGHGLHWLPALSPKVAWYTVCLVTLQFVSHAVLCYSLSRMVPQLLLLVASLQIAIATHFWTHLQFTTTAAMTTLAGASLLFCSIRFKGSTGQVCMAWTLIFVGSLLRFQSAALVGILTIPAFGVLAWRRRDSIFWFKQLTVAVVAGGLISSSVVFDARAYESDPQWREFRRLVRAIGIIVNDLQYKLQLNSKDKSSEIVAEIERAGLSRDDQLAMCAWLYSDPPGAFSIERLEAAAQAVTAGKRPIQIVRFFAFTAMQLAQSNVFILLLGTSLAVVVFSVSNSKTESAPTIHANRHFILQWLFFLGAMTYIHWNMKLPSRVFLSGALTCLVSTMAVATNPTTRRFQLHESPKLANVLVLLAMLGSGWIVVESVAHSREFAKVGVVVKAELIEQLSDPDCLTVITVPFPFDRLHPFDNLEWMRNRPYVYLDGHQRSPRQRPLDGGKALQFYCSNTRQVLGVETHLRRQFGELVRLRRAKFGVVYSLKKANAEVIQNQLDPQPGESQ